MDGYVPLISAENEVAKDLPALGFWKQKPVLGSTEVDSHAIRTEWLEGSITAEHGGFSV